jgi:hypothetical protein
MASGGVLMDDNKRFEAFDDLDGLRESPVDLNIRFTAVPGRTSLYVKIDTVDDRVVTYGCVFNSLMMAIVRTAKGGEFDPDVTKDDMIRLFDMMMADATIVEAN